MDNKIIYSLTISDIQGVAQKETGKKLSNSELDVIIENINKNISWYEIIAEAINELDLSTK